MHVSKKNVGHEHAKIRARIEILEAEAKRDPLKKNPKIHEELAKLKKQLEE